MEMIVKLACVIQQAVRRVTVVNSRSNHTAKLINRALNPPRYNTA